MTAHRAAAAVAAALLCAYSAAAQPSACDRACLEGLLDTYVDAVVAHDATRLPLAAEVKFTENGQRLRLDDGLWHTAAGKGGYALRLADVERGLIGPVESVLHQVPYGMGSGWSTWEDSLSSEPQD